MRSWPALQGTFLVHPKAFVIRSIRNTLGRRAWLDISERIIRLTSHHSSTFSLVETCTRIDSSSFTTEATIRLHYQRATCPALLVEWVQNQHFGIGSTPTNPNPQPDLQACRGQIACEFDLQWRPPLNQPRIGDPMGLYIPPTAPAWHPTMMANMLFDQSSTLSLSDTPVFWPDLRLRWYTTFS